MAKIQCCISTHVEIQVGSRMKLPFLSGSQGKCVCRKNAEHPSTVHLKLLILLLITKIHTTKSNSPLDRSPKALNDRLF